MKNRFILRALIVFTLLVAFRAATTCIAPLINNLLTEQGFDFSQQAIISGTVLSLGYIATIVGSIFGGKIADKMGAVKTIVVAGSIFSAAFIAWAFTGVGAMLYISRVILALCTGTLYVALQSYILGGAKKGSEGMALGIYGLAFGVGTALAGAASGMADSIGISKVFMYMGFFCAAATIAGSAATRIDKRWPTEDYKDGHSEITASPGITGLLKKTDRSFAVLLLNSVLYGFGLIIFLQYIDELGAARGLSGTKAAFGIAIFSILSLLQPLTGIIADKIGKTTCVLIGQSLITVGWCLLALLPHFTLAAVMSCSAIAGIGAAFYSPAVLAMAQEHAPAGGGGAVRGLYQAANSLGSAVAAIFGSVIYLKIGITNVFILLVASCILGLLSAVILLKMNAARGRNL